MNKDLHNIDDIFNSAQQRFEEDPSADVWDKIDSGLDKKDADSYRRRFIGWKRVAIILILFLSGFVLYESGIIRRISGTGNQNNVVSDKNSLVKDKPVQEENAVNTDNNESGKNTVINDFPVLSADKVIDTETNKLKKPATEKEKVSASDIKKIKIINKDKNTGADQVIAINNAAKSKVIPDEKITVSSKKNESDNSSVENLMLTNKNNKPKSTEPYRDNNIVGKNPATELMALNKIRMIHADKMAVTENFIPHDPSGKALLLLIPDSVLAKIISEQEAKKGARIFKPYWTISGFASNDLALYKLENDEEDHIGPVHNEKDVISKRERHESSFSAGIIATRQFTKRLGIKSGLIYSNIAIVIDPQKLYAAQTPNGNISYKYITSSGYAYVKPGFGLPPAIGDSLNSAIAQHKLQSLSIPVMLTYKLGNKKFSISPSAGITANFIASAKVETEVEDALNRETVTINGLNGTKHFYIGFTADVNLQYNLHKRWAINLLPAFQYALSPITKSNVVKTYPYSLGVGMGLTYKF